MSSDGLVFSDLGAPISGPFPTVQFPITLGLGHYVGATSFTAPGRLFVTWSEPIETAASCVECQGLDYGLHVLGAEVRP